jgi:pseudouridylate synthase
MQRERLDVMEFHSARGITGKALTPFLLDSIRRATEGRGLRANCAQLEANARVAAEVARARINSG